MRVAPPDVLWPDAASIFNLSDHQREQLSLSLTRRLGLLTGTPGTGKTHSTGSLANAIADKYGMKSMAVCAPTGKAAVRVTAAMRRAGLSIRATTIHTLLEIGRNGHDGDGWGFNRNADNPLDQTFVIVDEASMVDIDLAASLFSAIGPETHLLFVGDPYQLPPVGHGSPLRDMITAGVPNGHLTEIRRSAGLIVRACAAIKDGQTFETADRFDPDAGLNLRHLEAAMPEAQIEALLALYGRLRDNSHGWHTLWDVQVIIATNDSGPLSRKPINRLLQTHLNPTGASHPDHNFKVGDKIICLRNHFAIDANDQRGDPHYIANGEIGEVIDISQPRKILAQFSQPERFILIPASKKKDQDDGNGDRGSDGGAASGDFDLAYAITCHKSQGSEFSVVIVLIDASSGARRLTSREWWYTSLSRASDLCITIGRLGSMQLGCKRSSIDRRKTLLAELIDGRATR